VHCHPNFWVLVIAVSAATGATSPAVAQQPPESSRRYPTPSQLLAKCPPDHRIEFVLPTITLYVDPNWLGPTTQWNLVHAYGANCPTWPVKADGLDFGPIWFALDIHTGLGRKLIRFGIGPQRPDKLAAAAAQSQTAEASRSPYIEDLTTVPPYRGVFGPGTRDPLTRIYRLHHVHTPPGADGTAEIVCGGHPEPTPVGLRGCSTSPDYTYEGLSVAYNLSQTDLPLPEGEDITSTDPKTEPGALLEFDTRLRAWITNLKKRSSSGRIRN